MTTTDDISHAAGMLRASHAGPTLFVTAIATLLAWGVGQTGWGIVLVAAAVFTGQLSIGWSNDWLDAARDVGAQRVDKPIVTQTVTIAQVRIGAFIALGCTIGLSFANGWQAGLAQLGLVASGWVYNLGLKSTVWSPVPYAIGFGLLPAFVTLSLADAPWPPAWAMAVGGLLGVGAHFANVLPDIDDDLAHDVRGLPQRLGRTGSGLVALILLSGATVVVFVAPSGSPDRTAWLGLAVVAVVVVLALWCLRPSGPVRLLFPAVLLVAFVDLLMVLAAARNFVS
jgi:4-hydroxybenzoate polyprenyltransferase